MAHLSKKYQGFPGYFLSNTMPERVFSAPFSLWPGDRSLLGGEAFFPSDSLNIAHYRKMAAHIPVCGRPQAACAGVEIHQPDPKFLFLLTKKKRVLWDCHREVRSNEETELAIAAEKLSR